MTLLPGTRVHAKLLNLVVGIPLGAPVAADDNRIVTSADIADVVYTIAANVDTPRNLTVTLTDADDSVTAGTLVITGLDMMGRTIQESFDLTSGSGVLTGTKIFAKVTSVEGSLVAGAVTIDDVLIVGVGTVIGLPIDAGAAFTTDDVQPFLGNVPVTVDAVATGESTTGFDCSTATYNGTKLLWALYNVGH